MSNFDDLTPVDKDFLYKEYQRGQRWRDKLSRKLAHKSVDIPDDEMNLNVRNGWGWKELVVLGAIGVAAAYFMSNLAEAPPWPWPPAVAAPADRDTTRRTEIEKYIPE